MSLETKVHDLATRIGTELKAMTASHAAYQATSGEARQQLASSIAALQDQLNSFSQIDDEGLEENDVWSAAKIMEELELAKQSVKDDIINGAGTAFDTLKELADEITNTESGLASLLAKVSEKVSYVVDQSSSITAQQKSIARTNIGAAAKSDFDGFVTSVGNVNANFVATFEGALVV